MLTTTTTMTDRDQLRQRAESDLFLRIYPAEIYAADDDDMSEDAWLIIGLSPYGEIWIHDNTDLATRSSIERPRRAVHSARQNTWMSSCSKARVRIGPCREPDGSLRWQGRRASHSGPGVHARSPGPC